MKKDKSPQTEQETEETPILAEEEALSQAPKVENKITKVGSLLKEMRLQKGLRLPDVAKKLCIRRVYLEAIEESNYAEVPAFPYGIGFVRSYATFLGLNSGNIVELYKDETMPKSDKEIYMLEPQSEASVPNKKYLLISLLAIALVYGGWSAYNKGLLEEADKASTEEQTEEVSSDTLPIVVEDFSAEPVMEGVGPEEVVPGDEQITVTDASFVEEGVTSSEPETIETKDKEEVQVSEDIKMPDTEIVIKIKEETWIEVRDAEKLYISKVLKPGMTYTVPQGEGMILSVGKVNGVEVLINGVVTSVVKPNKKMNIALDPFVKANGTH